MQSLMSFLSVIIPTKGERLLMLISGGLGGLLSFALGGLDLSIQWLFFLVCLDYATGLTAALKTGEWNSSAGFQGLFKKFFIFLIVAVCNGIDQVMSFDILRNAAIMAYAVNEAGSILENLERLGFGEFIPDFLRRGLKALKEKENDIFKGVK